MLGRLTISVVLAAAAWAQGATPEVRGVIHEAGSTTGIAGVEVGLYQFGPNEQNYITRQLIVSAFTDGNGAFSLKPGRLGEFTVSAKKEGYQEAGGRIVLLSTEAPVQTASMTLIRPGSLTGRVIDRDGSPVANFPVIIETASLGYEEERTTDANGYFTSNNLRPGEYVVHIRPRMQDLEELLEYREAAFKIVDQDAEPLFWPGGLPDRESVVPVPVAAGGGANIGTIVIHKVPYYRVHVSLAGKCAPNERWIYRILKKPSDVQTAHEQFGACREDFLLTGLKPGAHTLAVWVGRDVRAWGLVPFTITNANVEATLRLTPSISVSGQVKAAAGHTLAELGPVTVLLRPDSGLGAVGIDGPLDANGMFSYKAVAWPQQLISVDVRQSGTYVKEIRYNGLPGRSPRVDMVPGARFEVLIDSGAATLTGRMQSDGEVFVVRDGYEPFMVASIPPFQFLGVHRPGEDTYTRSNLPPGTYRVMGVGRDFREEMMNPEELGARLARAEKVTVQANEQKSFDVKK